MKINYLVFTKEMAEWLRKSREALNLSQGQVGQEINEHQAYVSKHERGDAAKILKASWEKLAGFYMKKGVKPIDERFDPLKLTPDPKKLLKNINTLKRSTGSSWVALAATLKVEERDLISFKSGKSIGTDRLIAIYKGYQKLTALPQKLADEGVVSQPKSEMKKKKKKKKAKAKTKKNVEASAKKSVLEKAPEVPTELAIAMQIYEASNAKLNALATMQKYTPTHGNFLNGKAGKMLHT